MGQMTQVSNVHPHPRKHVLHVSTHTSTVASGVWNKYVLREFWVNLSTVGFNPTFLKCFLSSEASWEASWANMLNNWSGPGQTRLVIKKTVTTLRSRWTLISSGWKMKEVPQGCPRQPPVILIKSKVTKKPSVSTVLFFKSEHVDLPHHSKVSSGVSDQHANQVWGLC